MERLNEHFADRRIPPMIAFELYSRNPQSPTSPPLNDADLLSLIGHRADADTLIDCYADFAESQQPSIRLRINAAIPYPRQCSSAALSRYLAQLDTDEDPNALRILAETLRISKRRILRSPEVLDSILFQTDRLDQLLHNPAIRQIFDQLTVDILESGGGFSGPEIDAAIAILHQIAEFVDYDEDRVHAYIGTLADDEEMDSVRITAAKFLIRHNPQRLLPKVGRIFVRVADTELRIEILNRLLLTTAAETPNLEEIRMILDESVLAETNPTVHLKALQLAEKLLTDAEPGIQTLRIQTLRNVVETDQRNSSVNSAQMNADEITAMIRNVRLNGECDLECISKECY